MPTDRAAMMQALYDQVPPIADCQGHCWISCGPASMTPWERRRLAKAGFEISSEEQALRNIRDYWCEALGPDGRCQAYDLRPMVCRLWGAVRWLACPWGCRPEGGFMDDAEAFRLLLESMRAGDPRHPVSPEAFERLKDPRQVAAAVRGLLAGGNDDTARHRKYLTVLPPEITRRRPARRGGDA